MVQKEGMDMIRKGPPPALLAASIFLIGASASPYAVEPAAASGVTALDVSFTGTLSASVLWLTGSGTFSFGTAAPLGCVASGLLDGQAADETCTITALGSFTSVWCETAEFSGTATITAASGTITLPFQMSVVESAGIVVGTAIPPAYSGSGVTQMTADSPQYPDSLAGPCTSSFTVVGDIFVADA